MQNVDASAEKYLKIALVVHQIYSDKHYFKLLYSLQLTICDGSTSRISFEIKTNLDVFTLQSKS